MLVPDPLGPGGERVKILDFGIAKLIADTRASDTVSNIMMGTPTYMSPENIARPPSDGDRATVRARGRLRDPLRIGTREQRSRLLSGVHGGP